MLLRHDVRADDAPQVRQLVEATGVFSTAEGDVAEELVRERLARGTASGYFFTFAERDHQLLGYACYGPIACTVGSFDLYWIAVRPDCQGQGLGRLLLADAEEWIRVSGGRQVYIETSSRQQYAPTRQFYIRCGYHQVAVFDDFYAVGDGKVVYRKLLA
jgi:GNAT superfamily N-acetyltransferase